MDTSLIFITISIAILAILVIFLFIERRHKGKNALTPLGGLAFGFVLAGLFTGDDRLIGYSLIGTGIVLAVIDIVRKQKLRKVDQ